MSVWLRRRHTNLKVILVIMRRFWERWSHLYIVRCLYTRFEDEDWYRSSVFHNYSTCDGKSYEVVIDEGNFVSIISKSIFEKIVSRNHTSFVLIRTFIQLSITVSCLFTFAAIMVVFGVTSYPWILFISFYIGHVWCSRHEELWKVKHLQIYV